MISYRARNGLTRTQARVAGILAAAVSGMVCLPALATDYHWVVADGTWNNGPNWNPFGEPLAGDNAFIDHFGGTCHVIGPIGTPGFVDVTNAATLDLEHNGLNDGFVLSLGDVDVGSDGFSGTLNIFGRQGGIQLTGEGHLSVGGDLNVTADSTVNQSGGTVTIVGSTFPDLNIAAGAYNLSGGVLTAPLAEVQETFEDGNISRINVSGSGVGSFGGLQVTNGTIFTQTGGQITVGTSPGGFTVTGYCLLQGGTLSCGPMTVSQFGSVSYQGGMLTTGALTINAGQMSLSSGAGKVLHSTSISIGTLGGHEGGLDLTDNAMIVDYTGASPLVSISALIKAGTYNIATGIFTGIISSTAITNVSSHKTGLGYGEASALVVSSFQGQSVDSTSILIRYTYLGDANLDGIVNALDFNMLASNFGGSPGNEVWTQGDFNADGIVSTLDFMALASNFGQPALSSPALATVVPEPSLLAFSMALGLSMRRRLKARRS